MKTKPSVDVLKALALCVLVYHWWLLLRFIGEVTGLHP